MLTTAKPRTDFLAGGGEMGERIRHFDWRQTPLGPVERWPQVLKTSVGLILRSRHPMWIGWGAEMTFLYNDAYVHVLGPLKHPNALGKPASEIWAEIWDVCGPLADKVFQKGEATFVDDVRLFMNRGDFLEETFYSFSYSPIPDEVGQVCGLFCPSTDVTPRILNARRLSTLSELSAQALTQKTTTDACASAARILARNTDDIPFALLYLADAEGQSAHLQQAVGDFDSDDSCPLFIELTGDSPASDWPLAEVYRSSERRIVPVNGKRGLPAGVEGIAVKEVVVLPLTSRGEHKPYGVLVSGVNPCRPLDVDYSTFFELLAGQVATAIQNAAAAEEERKRIEMLAKIDRAKTVFFSNVSHEFRTPLTLMLGPLESLLANRDGVTPEIQQYLNIAHRNSLRLLKLVNSLLDFSRIEAGRMKASYVATDLSALTADLASNFRAGVESAGLEISVDCPPLPEPVYVDREMWEKVVLNLLSNAFKFTFAGGIQVRVRATAQEAIFSVSDTGIGIPEEELPRIFERFHRVEGARGRTWEGTGIGLALIHELIKLHKGAITVESRVGAGTTFTVTLPFGASHLAGELILNSAETLTPSRNRAGSFAEEAQTWLTPNDQPAVHRLKSTEKAGRILFADDNADMREHVTHLLGDEYELVTARDGNEALQTIRRDPPDLLLTDIMMPGLDGIDLLREIRSDPSIHTLPVIFLSARAGEEMRVEGLEAGADDYLVKPFTANELRARVGTHLQMALARKTALQREAGLRAEAETARDQLIRVLESITDGFITVDDQWRLTYVNAEAERLNGMRREDMLGRNHWDIFPEAVGTTIYQEFTRAVRDGVPVDFENHYLPWNRWFHLKAYPRPEGGLSVFYEDITERKRGEELLRESERRFRELAEVGPQFIWVSRPDGTTEYVNERWTRYSGLDASSMDNGALRSQGVHPDDFPAMYERWVRCLQTGEPFEAEARLQSKEGAYRWFVTRSVPLRDDSGAIVKWFGASTDIDEQKRVEAELRRANQDLEQFAYSASHDLQEPLRAIKIYSELLTLRYRSRLDGQALEFLDFLCTGATRMEMLVRDLLAYTQVTRLEAPQEKPNSDAVLQESLQSLNLAIMESGARITSDPLPDVSIHQTHLKQLFQNLVGNAIKYRSPQRAPVVHVSAVREAGYRVFCVKDNGIGIAPEHKERVFGLFKRLHTGDEYAGTGIGLAICQRIVERYQGSIWLESEPGKGSTFCFRLPG